MVLGCTVMVLSCTRWYCVLYCLFLIEGEWKIKRMQKRVEFTEQHARVKI